MDRRPSRGERRELLLVTVIAALDTLTALGGAVGLASGALPLGPAATSRLPWGSATVGGIALALLVAVPNAVLLVLAARQDHRTGLGAVAVGGLLVGWILVELAFLRELSVLHPLYVGVGLVLVALGLRLVHHASGTPGGRPRHDLDPHHDTGHDPHHDTGLDTGADVSR